MISHRQSELRAYIDKPFVDEMLSTDALVICTVR